MAGGGGLQPVLDAIVEAATRLCHGEHAQLYLLEGDVLRIAAQSSHLDDGYDYAREHPHPRDRTTVVGRVALSGCVEQIPDVVADPEYTYEGQKLVGFRALLGVPIARDGELIGAIAVGRDTPGLFDEDLVRLVSTFGDQAALAIANARLLEALQRQLDRQQAIGEILRAITRAEGLQSVLDEIVETVTVLCGGDNVRMWLVEDGLLRAVANGGEEEAWEYDRAHPHVIDRGSATGRAALTKQPVHIPDVTADPEYRYEGPIAFRTNLSVPILLDEEVIGVFGIVRRDPEPFSDEMIELVQTFADQAAVAIANARLIDAVERQLDQQRAVAGVLGVVARAEGLEAVFDAAVRAAARLCSSQYGQLCIADGDVFRQAGTYGAESVPEMVAYERAHPTPRDRSSVVGRVAVTGEVVHIPDVLEDPEYTWAGQESGSYRALLGVPIFVDEELIGVINVVRHEPVPFTPEQIELVKTFADQVAIAIANARLIDAVERQRAELSRFVSPQVAELVSSDEGEKMLAGHRAYVTSMFCDLRGFTSFTELAEPEELFEVLREYHLALGELIPRYEGTLEHFAGDGLMVFFNDPLPVESHELKAVELALEAQQRFEELASSWRKRGHELGLGIGIAAGYATLGRIGFEGRYDYGVLGSVVNLASRLSSAAEPGQTLISQRVHAAVEGSFDAHQVGELELKGFGRPIPAFEVRGRSA
jgi:GAF domain-containing protein